jgi:hypothetical protein
MVVGCSVDMRANAVGSDVRLWVNSETGVTLTTEFDNQRYLDSSSGYEAWFGAHKQGASSPTIEGEYKGFLYNLYIYNKATATGPLHAQAGSCTSPLCDGKSCTDNADHCLANWGFKEYGSASACKTSCDSTGCVRDEECGVVTCDPTFDHCDLCFDRECTKCTNYYEGNCVTDECTGSTDKAENDTGNKCKCKVGNGRTDKSTLCKACYTNCNKCDPGGNANYSDCEECSD